MYAIGLDFGTLSVRALLVETATGRIVATAVSPYRHGVIDEKLPHGGALGPDWALQHPQDWLDGLTAVTREVLTHVANPADVVGIGMDFTSCTVLPVDAAGTPLCQLDAWQTIPNAWPKLWKHHLSLIHI